MSESDGIKKDAPESESVRQDSVRLDETVKLLFEVSKELLVKTINSLFNENFDVDSVEIDKTATEYPNNSLDMLRADMFISITENKPKHYHIEIQNIPHKQMAIRMFEYGITKALSNYRLENPKEEIPNLFIPKSIVIQIEDGESVPQDYYTLNLTHNEQTVSYNFSVMRYFEYDEKRLIQENLFALLPLQVFMLRKELDKKTNDKNEEGRQAAILKARETTERIARKVIDISKDKFNDDDVDKIMIALSECFQHLNNRYQVNEKLNAEVNDMVRTFLDDDTRKIRKEYRELKESKIESIKKMLLNNEPLEKIIDYTNATEQEIQDVQNKLNKN